MALRRVFRRRPPPDLIGGQKTTKPHRPGRPGKQCRRTSRQPQGCARRCCGRPGRAGLEAGAFGVGALCAEMGKAIILNWLLFPWCVGALLVWRRGWHNSPHHGSDVAASATTSCGRPRPRCGAPRAGKGGPFSPTSKRMQSERFARPLFLLRQDPTRRGDAAVARVMCGEEDVVDVRHHHPPHPPLHPTAGRHILQDAVQDPNLCLRTNPSIAPTPQQRTASDVSLASRLGP